MVISNQVMKHFLFRFNETKDGNYTSSILETKNEINLIKKLQPTQSPNRQYKVAKCNILLYDLLVSFSIQSSTKFLFKPNLQVVMEEHLKKIGIRQYFRNQTVYVVPRHEECCAATQV